MTSPDPTSFVIIMKSLNLFLPRQNGQVNTIYNKLFKFDQLITSSIEKMPLAAVRMLHNYKEIISLQAEINI